MGKFHKLKQLLALGIFILLLSCVGASKASANHETTIKYDPDSVGNCDFRESAIKSTSQYIYRSVQVSVVYASNAMTLGQTFQTDCALTKDGNSLFALQYFYEGQNLTADQVWFGPQIPEEFSAYTKVTDGGGGWGYPSCVPDNIAPTLNRGVSQCPQENFEIAQDDAGLLLFNGNMIYCNGMRDECGQDVYQYGTETHPHGGANSPIRGAGFLNRDATALMTSNIPSSIPLRFIVRNTWTGGYSVYATFTMRYPRTPSSSAMTLTPSCSAKNVAVSINGTLTGAVNYTINGWPGTPRSVPNFNIDMSSLDQNLTYNLVVVATVNGVQTSKSTTYYCPPGGGGGGGPPPEGVTACRQANPSLPNLPDVTVNLPDQSPNSGSPSGATNSPGQTHHEYNPIGETRVRDIDDISSGGNRVPPSLTSESYQKAVINYSGFISTYPYDFNQPNVTYDSYYDDVIWRTSSSPDFYTCSSGSLEGSQCRHEHPKPVVACPNAKDKPPCYGPKPADTFTNATKWYNWNKGSTTTRTTSNTVNGSEMNPCYDRGYRNANASPGQPVFDDEENPSQVTFTDTGSVDMWLPSGNKGLRAPLKVKLDASATFYIKHSDGSLGTFTEGHLTVALPANNTMYNSGSTSSTASDSHGYVDVWTAHIPPLRTGDKACVVFTVSPKQGTMKVDGTRTSGSGSSTSSEQCSSPLVDKPYFKVFGSDVQAGGAFQGGNCTQTGTITAFFRNSVNAGSSSQFAALALGQITGFGSSAMRGSGTPFRPLGLTFANTSTNVTGEQMGGNFATSHCITDYWSKKPASATAQGVNAYGSVASADGPVYLAPPSGTATITAGGNITGRKTIYVDGNAVLSGNFIYNTPDAWANENAIPSLFIIARGNIYVDSNTTQLDGVYIAEPKNLTSPTDGKIYSCASGTTPIALGNLNATCNKRLTINGAFIASQVKLLRTTSSLRHATADEYPQGTPHACLPNGLSLAPVCAAEIFNFSPEVYLAQPALPIVRSAYQGKYDYITSLPPVL